MSAIIGPFIHKPNFVNPPKGVGTPILGGLGVMALGDLNDQGSLEVGIFFLSKTFFREEPPDYLAENIRQVHVTMGYRYWINRIFSASLSFSSAYPVGDYTTVHNGVVTGKFMDTSARDLTEYGFDFSIQSEVWNYKQYGFVLDTRYSRSVTAKDNEKADHYGILLGFRYMVQEKYPSKQD